MLTRLIVPGLLAMAFVAMVVTPACAKRSDRDKDGLPDRWERRYGFSTHLDSAKRDPDRDRLTNRSEYRHHTNPRRKDTDRDGLSDGAELRRYRTNPRRKDTDRDGYSDGQEVAARTDPRRRSSHPTGPPAPVGGVGGSPATPPPPGGTTPGTPGGPPREVTCGITVSSVPELQQQIRTAPDGSVVCVAGGSYPALSIDAARAGWVTVAGAPGQAVTFADIGFTGSAAHVRVQSVASADDVQLSAPGAHDVEIAYGDFPSITLKPGVHDVSLQYNRLHGGDFGVLLSSSDCTVPGAPSWSGCEPEPPIANVTINGNRFQGPFGEDAMQVKNFRNVVVTNNEITEVREDGSHNDCLQSTFGGDGLVFRGNFEHDNRCQGFFIKDGRVSNVTVEDNLFVKNDRPCLNKTCANGAPMTIWLTGVRNLAFRGNAVWDNQGGFMLESGNTGVKLDHNVIQSFNVSDASAYAGNSSALVEDFNLFGDARTWRSYLGPHSLLGTPSFVSPAAFDYRLTGPLAKGGATYAAGVDWRPADKHFGP